MLNNNFVTILDFGSSKITCMAASPVADSNDFVIKAVGQSSYNGFDDNSWYEPELIKGAVIDAIEQVESKMQSKIKEIYVGVPGAFCAVSTSEASLNFHSKKKIDQDDIDEIIDKADIYNGGGDVTPLGGKPIYFILDGAIKSLDPINNIATKLTALVSFSFMKNYFRNTVASALLEKGIKKVVYVNVCEAQSQYISQSMGANSAIIIDIGHITTNVMLYGGNSLLFEKTFALGSGYLASDLCTVLGCDFNFAMSMLEKVNLNLEIQTGDAYSVNGKMTDAYQANEIVKARISQIAEYIVKCFSYCDKEIPSNTDVILTGGGLTYIRGGVDTLSQYLGKTVKPFNSINPQTRRNEYTSCYGLINQAVKNNKSKKSLFSIFGKGQRS